MDRLNFCNILLLAFIIGIIFSKIHADFQDNYRFVNNEFKSNQNVLSQKYLKFKKSNIGEKANKCFFIGFLHSNVLISKKYQLMILS